MKVTHEMVEAVARILFIIFAMTQLDNRNRHASLMTHYGHHIVHRSLKRVQVSHHLVHIGRQHHIEREIRLRNLHLRLWSTCRRCDQLDITIFRLHELHVRLSATLL